MNARHALVALLCAAAAVSVGPAAEGARAHGETTPVIRTVVDGVTAPAVGVYASMVPGLPTDVALLNTSAAEVTVIGDLGEPFLRIGPAGTYANVNSATWYASGNPDGIALNLPPQARHGAPARWARVSSLPRWAWFDRRVQPPANPVPMQARAGRKSLRLVDWSLPLRYRGRPAQVRGHVEFRPPVGAIVARLDASPLGGDVSAVVLGGRSPGLFVANLAHGPITVIGGDGRPFARIGPRGVQVNLSSPTYVANEVASGANVTSVPPDAVAHWRWVADVPRYGWVEPRLRYPAPEPAPDVLRQSRDTVLKRWAIPIDTPVGRRYLRGSTDWIPLQAPGFSSTSPPGGGALLLGWVGVGGAVAITASVAALWLRRHRARQPLAEHAQAG